MSPGERARAGYVRRFGDEPEGVVFAPGRVNLIGEHVDYNQGLVLPMPIAAGTAVAWGPGEGVIEAVALDFDGEQDRFVPGTVVPHQPADWRSYLRGMAASLAGQGHAPGGARLAIAGSIPRGSGLSSSASLCVGLGRALAAARGGEAPPARFLARAAQAAEHEWAGVNCGIMDQMAVAAGEPGEVLLIDCADLSVRPVRMPDDWAVLIVQSGITRGLVDGHYNARRADCEAAARALGVGSLREASAGMIAIAQLEPAVHRRARHVVSEIARVEAAVAAIERADLPALGELLGASHASLRDDFEVSLPAIDHLVEVLGAAIGKRGGARMTGGGFGGAVVAVLASSEVARVAAAVEAGYRAPDGAPPQIMVEQASRAHSGTFERTGGTCN